MQCNIDQRGRMIRFIGGIVALLIGILILVFAWNDLLGLAVGVIIILAGLFQLFEARQGWCAIRALGIRTPW